MHYQTTHEETDERERDSERRRTMVVIWELCTHML